MTPDKKLEDIPRIAATEVRQKIDRGENVMMIDTRSTSAWDNSDTKIKGARRIRVADIEKYISEIPRDRMIVTYCT